MVIRNHPSDFKSWALGLKLNINHDGLSELSEASMSRANDGRPGPWPRSRASLGTVYSMFQIDAINRSVMMLIRAGVLVSPWVLMPPWHRRQQLSGMGGLQPGTGSDRHMATSLALDSRPFPAALGLQVEHQS